MILQERDKNIIDFLDKIHAAKCSQLSTLFFPNKYICQRRLKMLMDTGHIKRFRDNVNAEYIYAIRKETNKTPHYLMLVDFYIQLKALVQEIYFFEVEKPVDNIIPDGSCFVKYKGVMYYFFIEIHRSNNPILDVQNKYVELFKKHKHDMDTLGFKRFPWTVIVTDRNIEIAESIPVEGAAVLHYIKIKGDSSDIKRIFFH